MPGLIINPRARIFHGHEWVYSSEIKKLFGNPQPGDVVTLKDFRDRSLGSAIYNPNSQIVARRFSRRTQELDFDFFKRRIERAAGFRATLDLRPPGFARIVWSESDGLPGVIVDRYGDYLVLQTNTLAMDRRRDLILKALREIFEPRAIIERNDSSIRVPEGLENRVQVHFGEAPESFPVDFGGAFLRVDLLGGQKSGLYRDQWDTVRSVASLAAGRKVLDCFSNQGGFALACKGAGAAQVTAVESSAEAVATGRQNSSGSNLEIEFVEGNAFDFLKGAEKTGITYGMVILDPPSFTRSKRNVKDAIRGYKEIHLRSLRLLEPEGLLITFCCSHHLNREEFLAVVADSAVDAKTQLRIIADYGQRPDHPVLVTIPETHYLKGFAFQRIAAF